MRRPEGLAGFATWAALDNAGTPTWLASEGLLDGAIGVGLALLAAVHPIDPAWDRMLLCDLHER